MIKICLAGATGWTGAALAHAILDADDLELVSAVARSTAHQDIGSVLGRGAAGVAISPDLASGLETPCDVLIDYTHPTVAMAHVMTAIEAGVPVVLGTAGLTAADFKIIDKAARDADVGVLASGNFSLTAALLQHFALFAAQHIKQFEIIDYGSAANPNAPTGTAGELAERLGEVCRPVMEVPLDEMLGPKEIRGAEINGVRTHSIRLPSFTASVETVFAIEGARLTMRHDAGESAQPYVDGTLLAARRVGNVKGLLRGLDSLLFA
ncbi:MAG: 4-hydroxy-tetrahydrodipicolinate reductase [Alphaproteobacteria bacterium]|jgi:4-hydroxy-tetrahydrodipicolinate reductase